MRHIWALPLSWALLPIIFVVMLVLWFIQQIRNLIHRKNKKYWKGDHHCDNVIPKLRELYQRSPVFQENYHDLYCPRTPLGQRPTGSNWNTDHQCQRQGIYVATLAKAGFDNTKAGVSLRKMLSGKELRRGYHIINNTVLNHTHLPISGDQLIGYCLGYLFSDSREFDLAMFLLAGECKKHKGLRTDEVISRWADFNPGFNLSDAPIPVGVQDLTYLVSLRCGITAGERLRMDTTKLKDEYFIRFWLYGGFLRILLPTAGIWFKRGYSNDNNALMSAYVLYSLSESWFEKWIMRLSMLWTWSLAWPWLNGFHSGMLFEAFDGRLPTRKYMKRCLRYGLDMMKIAGECDDLKEIKSVWPSMISESTNAGEFICDEDQEKARYGKSEYHSTLGQLAQIAWTYGSQRETPKIR